MAVGRQRHRISRNLLRTESTGTDDGVEVGDKGKTCRFLTGAWGQVRQKWLRFRREDEVGDQT